MTSVCFTPLYMPWWWYHF